MGNINFNFIFIYLSFRYFIYLRNIFYFIIYIIHHVPVHIMYPSFSYSKVRPLFFTRCTSISVAVFFDDLVTSGRCLVEDIVFVDIIMLFVGEHRVNFNAWSVSDPFRKLELVDPPSAIVLRTVFVGRT